MTLHRSRIALVRAAGVFTLLAVARVAHAQPVNVDCKKTETQPECHARLQCKADEDLDDCQKRLLRCTSGETLNACKARSAKASNQGTGDRTDRPDDRRDRDDGRRDRDDRADDRRGGDERVGRDRRRDDDRVDRRADRDDNRGSRRHRGRGRAGDRRRDGHGFEANKTFGLGLEAGEPSGLDGKYFLSDSRALDFGVGWIYHPYYLGDGVHIYGDHLWHPAVLASTSSLELPFYVGVGARLWNFEYCETRAGLMACDDGSAFGIRVPLGLSFDFNNAPIDIFVQLVPTLDFLFGDYYNRFGDRNHFGIDGSLGIRFWFK